MTARRAYDRMKELGMTDVVAFNNLGLTAGPIDLSELTMELNLRGMLRRTDGSNGNERWKGTLQNMKAALQAERNAEGVDQYEMWFSHITDQRKTHWNTNIPAFAAGFAQMKRQFADRQVEIGSGPEAEMKLMPSSEDFLAIAALGGGFLQITQEQYDQFKTEEDEAIEQSSRTTRQNQIRSRIVNASALASERIQHDDSPEVQQQKWVQAWIDGV